MLHKWNILKENLVQVGDCRCICPVTNRVITCGRDFTHVIGNRYILFIIL